MDTEQQKPSNKTQQKTSQKPSTQKTVTDEPPDSPVWKRKKRSRINFTPQHLEAMENVFRQTQYPDGGVVEILSQKLNIPTTKIGTWFQNRRSKFRKESKKGHIQWMRQQLYGNSDRCTGLPIPELTSSHASHVLTPPSEKELKYGAFLTQMPHVPQISFLDTSQPPVNPYVTYPHQAPATSTCAVTPSPSPSGSSEPSTESSPEQNLNNNNTSHTTPPMTSWFHHQSPAQPYSDAALRMYPYTPPQTPYYPNVYSNQYYPYPSVPYYEYGTSRDLTPYYLNMGSYERNVPQSHAPPTSNSVTSSQCAETAHETPETPPEPTSPFYSS